MPDSRNMPKYVCPASKGGWALLVWVQPGAKKNEFTGVLDGRLRIRLSAPAVENRANKALVVLVAKTLGLKSSQVSVAAGDTGRRKRLHIDSESEPDWTRFAAP